MNFNDLFINRVGESANSELGIYTEMAIDFETGELIKENDEIKIITGTEALKVWVWRALKTELNKYAIHSSDYGNELHEEIGQVYNRTIKEQLLYDEIRKTLKVNPCITGVSNFSTTTDDETFQSITINFEIETKYGNIIMQREVFNV